MYILKKSEKDTNGLIDYLDGSEKSHSDELKKTHSLDLLEKFYKENNLKPTKENYEKYLSIKSNHEPAKITGRLGEGLTYSREVFSKALHGEFNGKSLRKTENRQTGYSMVATVPKSLSMLYALNSPEQQKIIRDEFNAADAELNTEFEQSLRPSDKKYKFDPAGTKMLMFEFMHYESRPKNGEIQPFLHKHKEIPNFADFQIFNEKTNSYETKRMAIDGKTLMQRQKELSAKFNQRLVDRLEKIGILTEAVKEKNFEHSFRVIGISREQEEQMSIRRSDMLKFLKAEKAKGNVYSSETEERRAYVRMESLRKITRDDKEEDNADVIHQKIKKATEKVISLEAIEEARKKELERRKEAEKTKKIEPEKKPTLTKIGLAGYLTETELRTQIVNGLKFTKSFQSLDDLNKAVDQQIKQYERDLGLVKLSDGKFTLKKFILDQAETLDNVKTLIIKSKTEQNNAFEANMLVSKFESDLKNTQHNFSLNAGQIEGCRQVARMNRIAYCVGDAGSGKTSSILKFSNDLYTKKGRNVIGLAVQSNTAENLKDAGIKHRFSIDLFLTTITDPETGKFRQDKIKSLKSCALVVDECGMIGSEHYKKLTELAVQADAHLILVGDPKQLNAVSAGSPIRDIDEALPPQFKSRLDENMRQKPGASREVAEGFRDRKPEEALEAMRRKGWLNIGVTSKEALMEKLASDYISSNSNTKVALANTNDEVDDLNDAIRKKLFNNGTLNKTEQQFEIKTKRDHEGGFVTTRKRNFIKGDQIMFGKNFKLDKTTQIKNGQKATITGIKQKGQNVFFTINLDGKTLEFNATENSHFSHAYCLTQYKSQGITVDEAFIFGSDKTNSNSSYVMFSRHKEAARLYIENSKYQDFIKASKEEQVKFSTLNDPVAQAIVAKKEQEKIEQELKEKQRIEKEREEKKRLEKEQEARRLASLKAYNSITAQMKPPSKPTPMPAMKGPTPSPGRRI